MDIAPPDDAALELFWAEARKVTGLTRLDVVVGSTDRAALTPPAWSFGRTAEQADELLALVLEGTKTATMSALAEFESAGEEVPRPGDLSIVCDGRGQPRALVRTDAVEVVRFDDVGPEHAWAEGEDDRSLESWREVHRRYLGEVLGELSPGAAVTDDVPVVLERFTVVHPRRRRRGTRARMPSPQPAPQT